MKRIILKNRNRWNGAKDIYYSSRTAAYGILSLVLAAILIITAFGPLINSPFFEFLYRTSFLILGAVLGSAFGSLIDDYYNQPANEKSPSPISRLGVILLVALIGILVFYGLVLTNGGSMNIPASTLIAAAIVAALPPLTSLLLDPRTSIPGDAAHKTKKTPEQ